MSAPRRPAFQWGVCGHPSVRQPLWSDWSAQFATLQERGLTSYRFDVPLVETSAPAENLSRLVELAHAHHVVLHPILYVPFTWGDNATDSGRYPDTDAGLEAQGYDRVYPVVLRFAHQIHDWELQNELSLRKGFKSGTGQSAEDYATPLAHRWAAVLRGMAKAVRDAGIRTREPLRVVVDTVYVDFGLIPFLESQRVPIDKVAYHYYYGARTSPYKIFPPRGEPVDLFAEFRKLDKPIIVNEFNAGEVYAAREGKRYDDAAALASLKTHIEYLLGQTEARIEGAEFYELYDEPAKDIVESNFGLMRTPAQPKTQMLLAAVYACGRLAPNERDALVNAGLFTEMELLERRSRCAPGR